MSHTRRLKILHRRPRAAHAPRGRRRLSHTRAIFEPFKPPKPSRQPSRGPASRAASRAVHEPSRAASSRQRAEGIFPGIFREYSPEYSRFNPANRPPYRIGFLTGSPIFGPDFNKVRPVPDYLDHSGSIYSVCLVKFGSQKAI